MLEIIVAFLIALFSLFWFRVRWKVLPGNTVLDYSFVEDEEPCDLLQYWTEKYGSIFQIERPNCNPIIFVSEESALRSIYEQADVFKREAGLLQLFSYGKSANKSSLLSNGNMLELLKFENIIKAHQKELQYFITTLLSYKGNAFNDHTITLMVGLNTMLQVLFGHRFDYDDPVFHHFTTMQENNFQQIEKLNFKNMFCFNHSKEDTAIQQEIDDNMQEFIEFYTENLKNNNKSTDFKPLIEEIKISNGRNFHDSLLNIHHIFTMGAVTIASTLRWILLHLILNPQDQIKIQEEIGEEAYSKQKFVENLVKAIFHSYKLVSLGSCFINHQEISLSGYRIPVKSVIYPNILMLKDCCHYSLEEKEKVDLKNCLMFGCGICPMESYLFKMSSQFILSLLSKFSLKTPVNLPSPSSHPVGFIILSPQPFLIQATAKRTHMY